MKKLTITCFGIIMLCGITHGQTNKRQVAGDTIDYTAKAGSHYKMIVIGDKLPKLYVNNKKISRADMGQYDAIIGLLQQKLDDRRNSPKKPK